MGIKGLFESMLDEGGKVSSKRFLALLFSLVAIYLFIFDGTENGIRKIDAILMFIGSLLTLTVANKHKAFQKPTNSKTNPYDQESAPDDTLG